MPHAKSADFELIFTEDGRVQLNDMRAKKIIWTSDSDDEFAEEFDEDFFDEESADDIVDYLIDVGHLEDDSEIDISSFDLEEYDEDEDDREPLEGEFIPKNGRRT